MLLARTVWKFPLSIYVSAQRTLLTGDLSTICCIFAHFLFDNALIELLIGHLARHLDRPLPQSSSRVCRKTPPRFPARNNLRISVAALGTQNPIIPGQQLYGQMIPRPECDEDIHRHQKVAADKDLESFLDCIRKIHEQDGLSEFERKQLRKRDSSMISAPRAIGYEVVPVDMSESVSIDTDSTETEDDSFKSEALRACALRSVSVRLTSDKLGYVDSREAEGLILQSDGRRTYCVSENAPDVGEGMEVIATGRFRSASYADEYDEEDELLPDDLMISSIDTHDPHLSETRRSFGFQTSTSSQVVYYRPPETINSKFKEE